MADIEERNDSIDISASPAIGSGGGEEQHMPTTTPSSSPPPTMSSSTGNLSSPRHSSSSGRRSNGLVSKGMLTDDQIDLVLQDLAAGEQATLLGAGLGKQTWSRYLVENYLRHYGWYNPNRDDPDAPSLSKGWAYFEFFTLPRRFAGGRGFGNKAIRAPPGEAKNTSLYNWFMTPQESLSDWGIGMVMYFSSLSAVFVIFILAGTLNVANILYYSSDEYDPGPDGSGGRGKLDLVNMLQFSAVCTAREWVVCSEGCDENVDKWNSFFTKSYYGTAAAANEEEEVVLINRTTCHPMQLRQGMIDYGTLMLLIVCMSLYMWYLKRREVRFDEDNTSAADYSVVVHNPPPDAVDPDEWRDFFDRYSEKSVTLCTVALNNESLLKKLVQRRRDIKSLNRRLPVASELDFEDERGVDAIVEGAKRQRLAEENEKNCLSKLFGRVFVPAFRRLGLSSPPEDVLWKRIKDATEEIRKLQRQEYKAAAVYVTFETEEGQRTALAALSASQLSVITNTALDIDPSSLFRGKVLRVEEASEPNAVRWLDLYYGRLSIYLRLLATFGITCGLVVLSAYILQLSRLRVNTILFAVILSTFNSIVPMIVRILVSYEKHYGEGSLQASLYLKITFFRWVNTAIITRIITPFLATLGEEKIDLINTINSLMISEMITSPLLRYLDFMTILNRHYFAPRAKTEEEMFACFKGGWYNLAERFTDFTKVLLLCTFYSTFYPLIYFFGAGVILAQYWMDKFLLLRSWQRCPYFGPEAAKFSRTYFNTAAILLGAISSGYAIASSPFTYLCSCGDNNKECNMPGTEYNNVQLLDSTVTTIETSAEPFYFCNQQVLDIGFPPVPDKQGSNKWMTDGQETVSRIYGWTCVVLLALYVVGVLGQGIIRAVLSLVKGVYKPAGCNQHKDFSSGIGLESFGYIPQMEVPGFHFPLLATNIDDIDVQLIGWKDPNRNNEIDPHRNYDNHNMIFDVPHETLHRSRNTALDSSKPREERKGRPIFSVVKHYPPEWALRLKENNQRL